MVGLNVTAALVCEAPNNNNICDDGTKLEGVFVNNIATDCELSIATNAESQCIKCADLAATAQGALQQTAEALIGTPTENIFTLCDDTDPRENFTALIDGVAQAQQVNASFIECIGNAAASPGAFSLVQAQESSSQENSLTTNVQPRAEIPSINTESQNQNPNVNSLHENSHVKALLQNPNLKALLENQDQKALIENPNVKALLEDSNVNAQLMKDPKVTAQLKNPTNSALTGLFP